MAVYGDLEKGKIYQVKTFKGGTFGSSMKVLKKEKKNNAVLVEMRKPDNSSQQLWLMWDYEMEEYKEIGGTASKEKDEEELAPAVEVAVEATVDIEA